MLLVQYPTCTTCKKAKKYLESHNISFDDRNIKEENPTAEELGGNRRAVKTLRLFSIRPVRFIAVKILKINCPL